MPYKSLLFKSTRKQARQEIIKEMSLYFIKSNVDIFKQGDNPGCFYILRGGTCDIIVDGEKRKLSKKEISSETQQ